MNETELLDAINNLNSSIQVMGGNTGVTNELLKRMAQQQGIEIKDVNTGLAAFGKAVNEASGAATSLSKANKAHQESMGLLSQAAKGAASGLGQFSVALLDSTRNFSKYNTALESFGDVAKKTGEAIHPLAGAIGNMIKGMTMVGQAALKQADNVNKAYDELAKIGNAGGLTTKEIMNMGLQAGLMTKDLNKLTDVAKANSVAIAGLGNNASEGMKIFGQMNARSAETIAQYTKLGVSNEDLIKTTGDYVALQMASGRSLKGEIQDKQKLQQASLAYQDNLLMLSQLTGEDVDSIKKKQREAAAAFESQMWNMRQENKARELERQGRKTDADKLRAQTENQNQGLRQIQTMATEQAMKGLREFVTTGTSTTEEAQALVRLGLSDAMAEYKKNVEAGADASKEAAKFADRYNEAYRKAATDVGPAATIVKDIRKLYFGSEADMAKVNQLTATRDQKLQNEVDAAIKRVQDQKDSTDPALAAREYLTKQEIKAGKMWEDFLRRINPLMGGSTTAFIALSAAVGTATAALYEMITRLEMASMGRTPGGGPAGAPGVPGGAAGGAGKSAGRAAKVAVGAAAGGVVADIAGGMAKDAGYAKTGAGLSIAGQMAMYGSMGSVLGPWGIAGGAALGLAKGLYENKDIVFGADKKPAGSDQQLLDFIARYESNGDYNVLVGGQKANLTTMTVQEVLALQSRLINAGGDSAAGKYQIKKSTLEAQLKPAGVSLTDKFDEATQDKLGLSLLKLRGLDAYKAKQLSADKFADSLALEWAALPNSSGKSAYDKVGTNKALVSREEFMKNLPQARYGAMFDGPQSGYLALLHGPETVVPNMKKPDLGRGGSVSQAPLPASVAANMSPYHGDSSNTLMIKLMSSLENKFDALLSVAEHSSNTQDQILRYSKA